MTISYPRVSLTFARKIDTNLIAFVRNVIALMTENVAIYKTPVPDLATVTTAVNTLETAVHEALEGGRIAIAARNAARAMMLSLMRQLAAYVENTCKADLLILLESGFTATKPRTPVGVLPPPADSRLSLTGTSGELSLTMTRVKNCAAYTVQSAESPNGPWEARGVHTSCRRIVLTGLTPGKTYWVRACANGSAGPSGWSSPVSAMAV